MSYLPAFEFFNQRNRRFVIVQTSSPRSKTAEMAENMRIFNVRLIFLFLSVFLVA